MGDCKLQIEQCKLTIGGGMFGTTCGPVVLSHFPLSATYFRFGL